MDTHRKLGFVASLLAALATPLAYGQSPGALKDLSIDELKRVYLGCDSAAIGGQLSKSEIMLCSVVYEELKQRAFGGDFDKLLAWSRAQPSAQNTVK
jgi:hypothetical protein